MRPIDGLARAAFLARMGSAMGLTLSRRSFFSMSMTPSPPHTRHVRVGRTKRASPNQRNRDNL